jgi:RNA polymerase sigma-70 factor (ECF subfamily)
MSATRPIPELVDQLFRDEAGRMIAGLVRVFGPARLELAEDVVQEALVRALRTWPFEGVPPNPRAWLVHVARNAALDALRRHATEDRVVQGLAAWAVDAAAEDHGADEGVDDQLRLMIMCCHPSIPFESRVALTLKTVCGLGVREIARAFLADEATIAQRLVRTKRRIQEDGLTLEFPPERELEARLNALLEVVYLLFNEGYSAHEGDDIVRADLVHDAARLIGLLTRSPATARPRVFAVAAIVYFQGARIPARTNAAGELFTLAEQDRTLWDKAWLARGWAYFERSIAGDELGAYHLEAAIASCHAAAPSYDATDWSAILGHYDRLRALAPSPIVSLNRAVALAKVRGPEEGLRALEELEHDPALANYPLLAATRGLFAWSRGDSHAAARTFETAAAQTSNSAERRLLEKRMNAARAGEPPITF